MSQSLRQLPPRRLCAACIARLRWSARSHPVPSIASTSATRSVHTSATLRREPRGGIRPPQTTPGVYLGGKFQYRQPPQLSVEDFVPKPASRPLHIAKLIASRIPGWSTSLRSKQKLLAYGIDEKLAAKLLDLWSRSLEDALGGMGVDEDAQSGLTNLGFDVKALSLAVHDLNFGEILEAALLRNFLTYTVSSPMLPKSLATHIESILEVTDITRLAHSFGYGPARAMSRHFHLHIGPTNSGKTYSALKRLSTAETGMYAGPLRLLAHEVWERMNLGTVGGMTAGQGRACNLMTGEERRIVDPNAGLMSCTVEMLPLQKPMGPFEVVVIDEIQMIGDPQRGGSWTHAIIGLQAKEIHLCGDETTVDLLTNIITSLGDKLTVHRYNRLTPLTVAEESLEGSWNNVEAGDCIVTFSRSNIFAVKKLIESTAGKKCAVVYGALPPETRADQARDFNDEHGRAEVLVASDAVGMGLNLKIKRMIFESLHKFNGKTDVPLALTQIKQIAGRAGRYGLHKTTNPPPNASPTNAVEVDDATLAEVDVNPSIPDELPSPGGVVTTFHKSDLPVLRSLLPLPLPSITRAVLDVPYDTMTALHALLPASTPFAELLDHLYSLVKLPPHTTLVQPISRSRAAEVMEPVQHLLTLNEIDTFSYSPVNQRDERSMGIFINVVTSYAEEGTVPLLGIFGDTQLVETLELVEETLASLPPLPPIEGIGRRLLTPPIIISSIPQLEVLHKALVLYIWLSFRFEVSFPDRPLAVDLKNRTEAVLDDCLARLPGLRNKKTHERGKAKDRVVREWRREHVSSDGRKRSEKVMKEIEEKKLARLKYKEEKQAAAAAGGAGVGEGGKGKDGKIKWNSESRSRGKGEAFRNLAFLPPAQAGELTKEGR